MHERSLVRQLLLQVKNLMIKYKSSHVSRINVSVGEFSGVEPSLLSTAFNDLSQTSPAAGAQLVVASVPLEAACNACSQEFVVHDFRFECPQCGNCSVSVLRGDSLVLESVVLDGEGA